MTESTPDTEAGWPPRTQRPTQAEPTASEPTQAEPTQAEPTQAEPAPQEPGSQEPGSRRRMIPIIVAVVAVVVVGAGVGIAALAGAFDGAGSEPAPAASTVTLASPTPTIEPAARQPVSTFSDALPSTVLSFALTAVADHAPFVAAGALEGHQLSYSDGGTGAVTVFAGQWETAVEASAAYTSMVAAAEAAQGAVPTPTPTATAGSSDEPTSGTVEVDGEQVGAWTVTTAPDGTATAWWTNGTALFQAADQPGTVVDFYTAFPL